MGGVWRQRMVIDEDTEYFTGGVYRGIVQDERLVFSWGGATDGWPTLDPATSTRARSSRWSSMSSAIAPR